MNTLDYNNEGWFRIIFADGHKTPFQPYTMVMGYEHNGKKYIAMSEYFAGCGDFNLVGVHEIK